ncbi:PilZ domain-containing protein [Radicibacter daui]|uniref:PilZ domain-containing protein n=1 Tax=Radicibacter daui TaxID=3064829 RepID=UPI004046A09A
MKSVFRLLAGLPALFRQPERSSAPAPAASPAPEMPDLSAHESRSFARLAADTEIEVIGAEGRYVCRLANISVGGALLTPPLPLAEGAEVTISVMNQQMTTGAHVVRTGPEGTAIAFAGEAADAAVLAGWSAGLSPQG